MKYIVFKVDGLETPIIFPRTINHSAIAHQIGKEVLSAGFVSIHDGQYSANGESHTLKIKSKPGDSDLIRRCLEAW